MRLIGLVVGLFRHYRVLVFAAIWLLPAGVSSSKQPVVAVDIGHLPHAAGATSARGAGEYFFNKAIAGLLAAELRNRNKVAVVVLNTQGDQIGLNDRTKEAEASGADLFVSIHHDSVQPKYLSEWDYKGNTLKFSDRFSGYSLFYSETNSHPVGSRRAAEIIGDSLRSRGFLPTPHHAEPIPGENRPLIDPFRGIYRFDDLVVLKSAPMPAVLIECGVIVNRSEEKKLLTVSYRQRLVNALAIGIEEYLIRSADKAF